MKKILFFTIVMLMSTVLLGGCGDNVSVDDFSKLNMEDTFGTLQGTIFDATTGQRLGGSGLLITLIQGTAHRSPNSLITNTSDRLVGEYAFTKVPIGITTDNVSLKIVVTNTGYQRFEGYVNLWSRIVNSGFTDTTNKNNFFFIGDIYLFPVGATASDITIYVERDGERIPAATVLLKQVINNNNLTADGSSNRIAPIAGMMTSMTATTDSDGKAVFSGSNLVLGGQYQAVALPMSYEGTKLSLTEGAFSIEVGNSVQTQLISMNDVEPGNSDDGLFVVFASNRDIDDVLTTGVLTVVFNRAIALVSENSVTATIACNGSACPNAVLDNAVSGDEVTAAVSSDGFTLTLTPNFTTNPDATDVSLAITYSGAQITVSGDELDQAYNLFSGISYIDGSFVSQKVKMTGPQQ